jgi:hypothetical protein
LLGQTYGYPSLRTIYFQFVYDEDETLTIQEIYENGSCLLEHHEPIHAFARMLADNEQVDDNQAEAFDCDIWDEVVVPRLEINLYRKRFLTIQKIQNRATRAAVMARALASLKVNHRFN